jgi:hypothetical protein
MDLIGQPEDRVLLDPGAEMPVRCDRMSRACRRYLRDKALRYGVVLSVSVARS